VIHEPPSGDFHFAQQMSAISAVGSCVEKVEKSDDTENLAKVEF
jgi:hypothetical protein